MMITVVYHVHFVGANVTLKVGLGETVNVALSVKRAELPL